MIGEREDQLSTVGIYRRIDKREELGKNTTHMSYLTGQEVARAQTGVLIDLGLDEGLLVKGIVIYILKFLEEDDAVKERRRGLALCQLSANHYVSKTKGRHT